MPLRDVLVAPTIHKNLLSVSELTKVQSCVYEFSDSSFLVKDR